MRSPHRLIGVALATFALFVAACEGTDDAGEAAGSRTEETNGAVALAFDDDGQPAPQNGLEPGRGTAGGPDAIEAPARSMTVFIQSNVEWSDPDRCTVTETGIAVGLALEFHSTGLVTGRSVDDRTTMGHETITRCGENYMGDWTTVSGPLVTVGPSYWDQYGIHLALTWWDATEIQINGAPVVQPASLIVAQGSLCQDWPGTLEQFLIPIDWRPIQPASCTFEQDHASGEVYLSIPTVDGEEPWRSVPDFLEDLGPFPTQEEVDSILESEE